ncbi:hypothetical protein AAG906_025960 [Vitis piasezkii]
MGSQNALLILYSEQGKWRELTAFYHQIRKQGFQPNSFTFSSLLKCLSSSQSPLLHAQPLHADAAKRGFVSSDPFVTNDLLTVYSRCGSPQSARKMFDEIPVPGPFCWNTMISCYFRESHCGAARELFDRMREAHLANDVTWSAVIAGYAQNSRPKDALFVFKEMRGISSYVENDAFVGSVVVDMYGKCGFEELARFVFDSIVDKCVVVWTALIASYVCNECPSPAIEVFREMIYEGMEPNCVTLSSLISACSQIPDLMLGKEIHGFITRRRAATTPDVFISTSLIDMYGKCNYMVYGHRIFEKDKTYPRCNTTALWNATIAGYMENNFVSDAWDVFRSITHGEGINPNTVTMSIVLPLCARSSQLLSGKEIHCYALRNGLDQEIFVSNGLIDMYSKCGKLKLAENQFNRMMNEKNRISWTSMIDGHGIHGDGEGAIRVFESMVREEVKPDHITFVALISACSHAGLLEQGLRYFEEMSREYGIVPVEENYGTVVDLLARAGRFKEARDLIERMPIKPGANVWGALLGACRIHGNVKEAELAAHCLQKLEPKDSGFQKLLASIYLEAGRRENAEDLRSQMRKMGMEKRQGFSWLETKEEIYESIDSDKHIPDTAETWSPEQLEISD